MLDKFPLSAAIGARHFDGRLLFLFQSSLLDHLLEGWQFVRNNERLQCLRAKHFHSLKMACVERAVFRLPED